MAGPERDADGGGFIVSPQQLGQKILEWKRRGYHVLSPAIQISNFAQGYGVNASLVLLNPDVDPDGGGTDTYFDKTTMKGDLSKPPQPDDERAPSKIGLLKIAAAAGVSWVNPYGRVDPLTIPNLWIYNVTGVYLAYDGTPQVIRGEKEIDYRDGSAQIGEWSREAWRELEARNRALPQGARPEYTINGWSEKRVRQARCNGAERAETGALERAIRTLGIKHVYTIAELQRPFVTLRVCPLVDMTDPDVRRQVTAGMLGGVAALYAGRTETTTRALPSPDLRTFVDVTPAREPAPMPARREAPPPQPAAAASQQAAQPGPLARAADQATRRAQNPPPPQQQQPPWEREGDQRRGDYVTVRLRDVKRENRKYSASHAKAGQTFTKYFVIDEHGQVYETIFGKWGEECERALQAGVPVTLQVQQREYNGEVQHEILNAKAAAAPARDDAPLEPGEDRDEEYLRRDDEAMKL